MSPICPQSHIPSERIRSLGSQALLTDGAYVLYWMTAYRRLQSNFSLQRALDWCEQLRLPLVIWEPIGCRASWSCDRFHAFALEGMRDQQRECAERSVAYLPYVEPKPGAAKTVLRQLADRAAVIVTDDFPCYIVPDMLAAWAKQSPVLTEAIDGNGLWPMRATDQVFPSAYVFRRFLQKNLPPQFELFPQKNPFARRKLTPLQDKAWRSIVDIAPPAGDNLLAASPTSLSSLPIDHSIGKATFAGGSIAAVATWKRFLSQRLDRYAEHRNDLDIEAASGLSPYLHFGHIGVHQIVDELAKQEEWSPSQLSETTSGSKSGWWNMTAGAESFLDELITWRELGFNFCSHRAGYDQYASLPDWARATLEKHASDKRPVTYTPAQLEAAETHDELWNAAQRQLVRDGRMHNYLRMLWGKKVLEWSPSPQVALDVLIDLNNKYAVDGRNPNSYSGIFWTLGRYDRPWGPERPIFGTIRYMSSDNTARKMNVKGFLARYAKEKPRALFE